MVTVFNQIISMTPPFNMIVLMMIIIFGTGLITSIAKQIRKYACHRHELEFKRDLLDRGMTIDEIERVVRAHQEQPPTA